MKIIVTGTVGLDKGACLERICELAGLRGHEMKVCHVGKRMYEEAPDVKPGRILDLPLARLHQLRRSVFKDILREAKDCDHLIVNTHATFRWKHGLFPAWDYDQLAAIDADMYICMIDNVDAVHCRLMEHRVDHSLKDILVWREEETLATEMMMMGCSLVRKGEAATFYSVALGREAMTAEMMSRLIFQPKSPRVYVSFPMTHVADLPEVLAEIEAFRNEIWKHFTVFDPGDLDEHRLYVEAMAASEQGRKTMSVDVLGEEVQFDTAEILNVAGDINAQIYARDFMLIDQADMILSYIPELPNGKPGLSSGVERELQHAYEATREVFVIWKPTSTPSPFITETATEVFGSVDEAMDYFRQRGYVSNDVD